MERKEKIEKKKLISENIDLGNGRYKDDEVDTLHELSINHEKYDGQTKTFKYKFDSWSSDGKYTREEETTFTLKADDDGIRIEKKYQYHDDDGQSGASNNVYSTGRDILNLLKTLLDD